MDKQYKRWKFWERWGLVQMVAGLILFCVVLILKPSMLFALLGLMGFVLIISGFILWFVLSIKIDNELLKNTFDRCPHCGQGWIKKEK